MTPGSPKSQPSNSLLRRLSQWVASPVFLWVVVGFGLAVRFRQYLFCQSYWYDEAFFILTIRARGFAQLLGGQPYNLVIPPVYLWITRGLYDLGGQGELLMRLPAFAAEIASVFMMIPLSRRLVGSRQYVWPVAFLAVCRTAVMHGCEVRPYTTDLLFMEMILYCALEWMEPPAAGKSKWRGCGLLILLALVGPWTSFPSAFALGGASLAVAVREWQRPARGWLPWVALNCVVCVSALSFWWFSARYMYSPGMIEHWGARGWGGFPDWSSISKTCFWILSRPINIGNYGNRELGIVLTVFAIAGGRQLAKRSPALLALLVTPFVLAAIAGMLGKYPLVSRTAFFLLPCLWLLAACGIDWIVQWGASRKWDLAGLGVFLIVWDFVWVLVGIARPDPGMNFRGAYQFIQARRQPDDYIWSDGFVVYQTYYGNDPHLLTNSLEEAVQKTTGGRLWLLIAPTPQMEQFLQATGRKIAVHERIHTGEVVLLEAKGEAENSKQ